MKPSHRKDVIIARVIFAAICVVLLAIIITLVVVFTSHGKDDTKPSESDNNTEITKPTVDEIISTPEPDTEDVVQTKTYRTTDKVRFRKTPGTDGEVISVLNANTEVIYYEEADGWAKVEYNGQTGYISVDYLKEVVEGEQVSNTKVILIDPGHQGRGDSSTEPVGPGSSTTKAKVASGTQGTTTGVPEYQLTLDIGLALRDELQSRGYTVYMTRETNDVNISNKERAEMAGNVGADISIRLHADGSESSSANGASILCPSSSNPYISNLSEESRKLSQCVIDAYCDATGIKNNGLSYRDDMTGFNWSTVTCTLLEMGFMSNPSDDTNMQDSAFQVDMVQGIANGIDAYFGL